MGHYDLRYKLHYSAIRGDIQTIQECLREGVNINDNLGGFTPLQRSTRWGNLPMVEFLTACCGADPSLKTRGGFTSLHIACQNGYKSIITYFIEKCKMTCDMDCIKRTINAENIDTLHFLIHTIGVSQSVVVAALEWAMFMRKDDYMIRYLSKYVEKLVSVHVAIKWEHAKPHSVAILRDESLENSVVRSIFHRYPQEIWREISDYL